MPSFDDMHSWVASVTRGLRGLVATTQTPRATPEKLLEIYEFESCPFCRKVREAMSELDLQYLCRPSARGSANRAIVMRLGGKEQFPFLVDPNTGDSMYESEAIITYLCATYGPAERSIAAKVSSPIRTLGASITSAIRPFGGKVVTNRVEPPAEPLELYNFEASPYCRKVRETLNALDLNHVVRNVAKRSRRRPKLIARGGKMMVPFLVDPNTSTEMYESDDIVAYLKKTYG